MPTVSHFGHVIGVEDSSIAPTSVWNRHGPAAPGSPPVGVHSSDTLGQGQHECKEPRPPIPQSSDGRGAGTLLADNPSLGSGGGWSAEQGGADGELPPSVLAAAIIRALSWRSCPLGCGSSHDVSRYEQPDQRLPTRTVVGVLVLSGSQHPSTAEMGERSTPGGPRRGIGSS